MNRLHRNTDRAEAIRLLVLALKHIDNLTDIVQAGIIDPLGYIPDDDWQRQYDSALAFLLENPGQDAAQLLAFWAENGEPDDEIKKARAAA